MICPNCQTEQPQPAPRFCDACGLALPRVRAAGAARAVAEPVVIRCQECGVIATSRRCSGCGARVRWPEDVIPPDEQEGVGKPPAPALELPDADEEVELVDAPPRDEEH